MRISQWFNKEERKENKTLEQNQIQVTYTDCKWTVITHGLIDVSDPVSDLVLKLKKKLTDQWNARDDVTEVKPDRQAEQAMR